MGHAEHSGDLRRFIESGKKIIITTLQKFPFILDEIGSEHRGRRFAIIIDEAHSSQGGRSTAKMHQALANAGGKQVRQNVRTKLTMEQEQLMEALRLRI